MEINVVNVSFINAESLENAQKFLSDIYLLFILRINDLSDWDLMAENHTLHVLENNKHLFLL